ncbi:MAG: DUF5979 domain-containing protein [Candidatus Nanopelagicales bacterium]
MQNYFPSFPGGVRPDLVVFITDGNPNQINKSGGGTESATKEVATNKAIAISNQMKTLGTHMFGITVGTNIDLNTIKAVTGDDEYPQTAFGDADFMNSQSYAALQKDLERIAAELCGASIEITKKAKTPSTGTDFVPAEGWKFDTTVTTQQNGKWVLPDRTPPANANDITAGISSTRDETTGNDGKAFFQWQPKGNTTTNAVKVKETVTNGYERDPILACSVTNVAPGSTTVAKDITVDPATGEWDLTQAFGPIKPGDRVKCTAKNTLTKLLLTKTVTGGGTGEPKDFRLKATPQGSATPTYSELGNNTTPQTVAGDVTYDLSEVALVSGYSPAATWTCTGADVVNNNQITVSKGTKVECNLVNARDKGSLEVTKQFNNPDNWTAPAGFKFLVDYNCNSGEKKGTLEFTGSGTQTVDGVPTGNCTITEQGLTNPAGWTWATPTYDPDNADVTTGKTGKVKVVNKITRNKGSLEVTKQFNNPDNWTAPAGFKFLVDYNCNSGEKKGTLEFTGSGTQTVDGVPTGNCTITEQGLTNPAGWTWATPTYDPDNADVTTGKTGKVKVVNKITRNKGSLEVTKQFNNPDNWTAPAGFKFLVDYNCNSGEKKGTLEFTGSGTQTVDGVPTGNCTITEQGLTNPAGWTWATPTYDPDNADVTTGKTGKVKVVNKITRNKGSLEVTKQFNNPDNWTAPAGFKFLVDYNCNSGEKKGTLEFTGSGTQTVDGVPTGNCTITEQGLTNPAGWTWATPTYDPDNADVTTGKTGKVKVVNKITRNKGSLEVTKQFNNPDNWTAPAGFKFLVDYNCNSGEKKGTLEFTGSGTQTVDGVPTGNCTITEQGLTNPAGWTWATPTYDPDNADVTTGKTGKVKVVNKITRNKGSLEVTKQFNNPDNWTAPAGFKFLVDYNCNSGEKKGTLEFTGSGTQTVDGVPTGNCTITEQGLTNPAGWTWATPTYDPDNADVTTGKTGKVKVVNKITRNKGSLEVTKQFNNPDNWTAPAGFKFLVDYNCNSGEKKGTLEFTGSGTQTVDGVPTGNCTITEQGLTNPAGWTWATPTYDPDNADVTTGKTGKVKVVNKITRDAGKLLLVKEVPEPTGTLTPEKWTLEAKNNASSDKNYKESGDNTVPQEVWAETPYTLSESPNAAENNYTAGEWSCEVQQDDRGTAAVNNGIIDGNVVKVPSKTTVVCKIVNTRDLAKLKLIKQVSGGKAQKDEFILTAKADPEEKQDLNISTPGGSGTLDPVYAETEYTLKETGPGGYSPSDWVCLPAKEDMVPSNYDEGSSTSSDKITLRTDAKVVCTIVNTRDLGSLTITKSFNPKTSGYDKAFDIGYKCQDEAQGTVSLKAGESKTINGHPHRHRMPGDRGQAE